MNIRSNSFPDISHGNSGAGHDESLQIIVGGRPRERVEELVSTLEGFDWLTVNKRLITNGHADVLHGVETQPDALILALSGFWKDELEALAKRPVQARPPAIIIGPTEDTGVLRLAMRAGARDYLSWPPDRGELFELLGELRQETQSAATPPEAKVISVINAKGGSGGTFIACSLANVLASRYEQRVGLVDVDLQFGNLAAYFDLSIKHSLQEVLDAAEQLDEIALKGYMTTHENSTLDILGNQDTEPFIISEDDGPRLMATLELMSGSYDQLLLDLPRVLDHLTIQALESSDKVLVVLQQNIVSIKEAKRLIDVMTNYLKIDRARIILIVNRFDKEGEISLADIKTTTKAEQVVSIPNDYARVSESLDNGIPLYESFPKAKITQAVAGIAASLCGSEFEEHRNVLQNALHGLRGVLNHGQ